MEPKFQTSFIPKNTVSPSSSHLRASRLTSVSIIPTIGTILFVLSIVLSFALFGYEHLLNGQIADSSKSLDLAKSEFDQQTLTQLITASSQISSAQTLLSRHVVVSNLFSFLESHTVPQVAFGTFAFDRNTDGTLHVSLTGEALSYGVLAEQAKIFSGVAYMKSQAFSGFDLTSRGTVSMKFDTIVDPSVVSYQKVLDANGQVSAPVVAPAVSAQSTTTPAQ